MSHDDITIELNKKFLNCRFKCKWSKTQQAKVLFCFDSHVLCRCKENLQHSFGHLHRNQAYYVYLRYKIDVFYTGLSNIYRNIVLYFDNKGLSKPGIPEEAWIHHTVWLGLLNLNDI